MAAERCYGRVTYVTGLCRCTRGTKGSQSNITRAAAVDDYDDDDTDDDHNKSDTITISLRKLTSVDKS